MQNKYTESMQVKRYAKIPATTSERDIMTRLGIKHTAGNTKLQHQLQQAIALVETSGSCLFTGAVVGGGHVDICGRVFAGAKLAAYMQGCDTALVMAATAGRKTTDRIERFMRDGAADMAVVLDAAAALAVDDALDFMTGVWAREKARVGLRPLNRRFSPGYGDLPLSAQRDIFDILDAGSLGIGITESYMLEPDKSVFAICGVERCV